MLHQGAVRLRRNDQDVAVQAQLLGVLLADVGVISVQAGSGNWMRQVKRPPTGIGAWVSWGTPS
jgi:hypothetical protein